jgi:N-acetylglucosaminylphosphatidylinositol deacetylase
MQLYLALAIPILLGTAWLYTAQIARGSLPNLRGKRICLLIAHPDDEAMFFSPTVLALTAPEAGNHVKILCLSSGASLQLHPPPFDRNYSLFTDLTATQETRMD